MRVCIGQGSHCKMKVFSIFTIGPRSSRGVWGHAPPENFKKLDTLDWLKLTFLHEKCDKIQSCSQHIYTKWSKNASRLKLVSRIHA